MLPGAAGCGSIIPVSPALCALHSTAHVFPSQAHWFGNEKNIQGLLPKIKPGGCPKPQLEGRNALRRVSGTSCTAHQCWNHCTQLLPTYRCANAILSNVVVQEQLEDRQSTNPSSVSHFPWKFHSIITLGAGWGPLGDPNHHCIELEAPFKWAGKW